MARLAKSFIVRVGQMCVVLALALSSGCGSGGGGVVFPEPRTSVDEEEEAPADRSTAVASAARAAQSGVEPKKSKAKAEEDAAKPGAATDEEIVVTKRRPARRATSTENDRPTDLAEWTHDDYRAAKLDRDARLIQAVLLLGRSGSNSEDEAKLLVELLAPTDATGPGGRRGGLGALGMAIAGALAANQSPVARTALKDILLGRLESDIDDKTLTVAALGALANNPTPDTEGIFYVVLTAPEAIRPPGRGTLTADTLQRECVGLIQRSASPQLRARLAEHVARDATSASHRAILLPLLLETRSENVKAQATLALSPSLDQENRAIAQRQLGQYGKRILDDLWGVPEAQQMRSSAELLNRRLEYAARVEQLVAARNTSSTASRKIESADELDKFVEQAGKQPQTSDAVKYDSSSGKDARDIPIKLSGARPTAIFRAQWPEYLEGKITAPVSPLRLQYARADVEESPTKLLAAIERELHGASQHTLENGRWIDSVSRPEPGRLRSVDVFVTRARGGATAMPVSTSARTAAEKLVVEILWLEIDDVVRDQ